MKQELNGFGGQYETLGSDFADGDNVRYEHRVLNKEDVMKHDRAEIIFDMARKRVCAMDAKISLIRSGVPATAQELMAIIEKREYELSKAKRSFALIYAK